MPTVRDLKPEDAPALTALYGEYDWWADREVDVPEGGSEELVRMIYERDDDAQE